MWLNRKGFLIILIGCCCGQPDSTSSTPDDVHRAPHNAAQFVEANNEFAINMYKRLSAQSNNLFFCPFCLMSTLSMMMDLSSGKTEMEINATLGFKSNRMTKQDVREACSYFNERIMKSIPNVVNALFMKRDLQRPSVEFARDIYNTEIRGTDFSDDPEQAVWNINELVRSATSGHVKQLFERIDTKTQMLILNALHFRTNFIGVFDTNSTRKARFYNQGIEDNQLEIFAMGSKRVSCKIADSYDFRALELPFDDKNSNIVLWIFLPHRRGSLADVEDSLSAEIFKEVRNSLTDACVNILIPKIKFDFVKDITKDLQKLGIRSVFSSSDANFRDLKKDVALTQVFQKSIIEIIEPKLNSSWKNENDTVSMKDVQPFLANHPFVISIVDKQSGMILYLGRLLEF